MSGPEVQPRKARGKLGGLADAAEVAVISTVTIFLFAYLSGAYVVGKAVGVTRSWAG